ncbi:MAG: peptidoglycan DD-metalloendopeptidase family protein [Winogradskyella sp.]|nr:peptidoglycan DD-metalloendopeptidase family protein [Winogradskyella sp.]
MNRKQCFIVFVLACMLSSTLFAQSEKQRQLELRRQQVLKELKQANALLFSNKKKEKSVITLIEDLNYKVKARQDLIRITNDQANYLTREINTNQKQITELRAQLQELKDDYAAMIVKSYKSKSEQSKVMFLLSSENFKQAYKRVQYIRQYREYQREQAEDIKAKTQQLQELNIKLTHQKAEKQKLIEENKIAKRQLENELKEREALMATIKADVSKYTLEIRKKQQEADRIDKEIDRLIKEAIAESNKKAGNATSTGKFILTPAAKRLAADFESNKGKLGWPVSRGVIKTKFGTHPSPIDRSVLERSYGIKIATEKNAKVKAVFNGEVSKIMLIKNANPVVMIRHGNYLTVYKNLSKIYVKSGQTIVTGQEIGEVFTNPRTGESMLGFDVYKEDKTQNPENWLAKF